MKISKALDTPLEDFLFRENQKGKNGEKMPVNSLDLLNEIVILVEENKSYFPFTLDTKNKGKLITKLYELVLKFPESEQRLFLSSFFEGIWM